jgi:hypothetical protein
MEGAEFLSKERGNSGACLRFESHDSAYQHSVLLIVGLRRAGYTDLLSTSLSRSFQCPGAFP